MQTLKSNAIAVRCPMSQQDDHDMSRQTFIWHALSIKLSMGFNRKCNKLLNQHNSMPQTVFCKEQPNENSLIVENIPSHFL